MPSVRLGNIAPIEARKPEETKTEVERIPRPDLGNTETVFNLPDEWDLDNIRETVTLVYHSHHSNEPPAWIESDDAKVAEALAKALNCHLGRPDDWTNGPQDEDE